VTTPCAANQEPRHAALDGAAKATRSLVCALNAPGGCEVAVDPQNAPSTHPLRPAPHAGAPGWGQILTMVRT
jgi:hypothetical protein